MNNTEIIKIVNDVKAKWDKDHSIKTPDALDAIEEKNKRFEEALELTSVVIGAFGLKDKVKVEKNKIIIYFGDRGQLNVTSVVGHINNRYAISCLKRTNKKQVMVETAEVFVADLSRLILEMGAQR